MASPTVMLLHLLLMVSAASAQYSTSSHRYWHFGGSLTFTPKGRNSDGTYVVELRNKQTTPQCRVYDYSCFYGDCGSLTQTTRTVVSRNSYGASWCQNQVVKRIKLNGNLPFGIRYPAGEGGSIFWLTNVRNAVTPWRMMAHVDLGTRSDTGEANRSPITTMHPFLRVTRNCPRSFNLTVFDPDGDHVRCRLPTSPKTYECGGCRLARGFSLDQDSCSLKYKFSNQYGYHQIELVVEDFPNKPTTLFYSDGSYTVKTPLSVSVRRHKRQSIGGAYSTASTASTPNYSTASTASTPTYSTASTASASTYSTASTASASTYSTASTASASTYSTASTASTPTYSTASTASTPTYSTASTASASTYSTASTASTPTYSTASTASASTYSTASTASTPTYSTASTASTPTYSTASTASASTYSTESTASASAYSTASTASTPTYSTASTASASTYSTESTTSASTYSTESTVSASTYSTESTPSASTTYSTESTPSASTTYSTESTPSASTTYSTASTASASTYTTTGTANYRRTIAPLSKLPLQFAVHVDSYSAPSCLYGDYFPTFLSPTPNNGVNLPAFVNHTLKIKVRSRAQYTTIVGLVVTGPKGISKHKISTEEYVIKWKPTENELNDHFPICFVSEAKDIYNRVFQSELRCVIADVGHYETKVTCNDTTMMVEVEKTSLIRRNKDKLHLNDFKDASCSLKSRSNSTHLVAVMSLNTCGTMVEEDEDHIIFKNEISSADPNQVISRHHDVEIAFCCVYPKRTNLTLGFKHKNPYAFKEKGFGTFTFQFEFFESQRFRKEIDASTYPVEVDLKQMMYMQIEAAASIPNTELFVESCRATPYDNPNSRITYTIIEHGCVRDKTVQIYPSSKSQFRFGMEAFEFIGAHEKVYITCSVLLCETGVHGTRCSQGCIKSKTGTHRGKREAVGQSSRHAISQGPLRLIKTSDSQASGPSLTLGLNLVFIVGVLLVCGVVIYRLKRSKDIKYQLLPASDTEDRDAILSLSDDEKDSQLLYRVM